MVHAQDVLISDVLAELGYRDDASQRAAVAVMVGAGLTNGRKQRIIASKIEAVRTLLAEHCVPACDDPDCRRVALAERGEQGVISVPPAACAYCHGDPQHTAAWLLANSGGIAEPLTREEIAERVVTLLAGGARRITDLVREPALAEHEVDRGDLRRLASGFGRIFSLRGNELLCLCLDPEAARALLVAPSPEPPAPCPDAAVTDAGGASDASGAAEPVVEDVPAATDEAGSDELDPGEAMEPDTLSWAALEDTRAGHEDEAPSTTIGVDILEVAVPDTSEAEEADRRRGAIVRLVSQIEWELSRRAGLDHPDGHFPELLALASERDALVRQYSGILRVVARLRNVCVHENVGGQSPIMPTLAFLASLERVTHALVQPHRAVDLIARPPLVLDAAMTPGQAVALFAESGWSVAVVRDETGFLGLLDGRSLLTWVAVEVLTAPRRPLLNGEYHTVGDLLARFRSRAKPIFRSSWTTARSAIVEVAEAAADETPVVLLFTPDGGESATPMATLTTEDLPRLAREAGERLWDGTPGEPSGA